jgi:hypothetical protein
MRDDDGERDEKAKLVRAIDEKARLVRAIIWLFLLVSSIGILAANLTGHCGPLPTRLCTETSSTELLRLSPSRLSREQVTPASPDWFPR